MTPVSLSMICTGFLAMVDHTYRWSLLKLCADTCHTMALIGHVNKAMEERGVWTGFLYREQLFPFFGGVTLTCFCWVGCACLQLHNTNLPYFDIFYTAMVFEAAILQGQVRITKQTQWWNWKASGLTDTLTGSDSLPSFQLDYKLCAVKFSHKQTITVSGK